MSSYWCVYRAIVSLPHTYHCEVICPPHIYQTNEQLLMCATEIIMVQIEQQLLLLWRISNDKKYVHVTIPILLCADQLFCFTAELINVLCPSQVWGDVDTEILKLRDPFKWEAIKLSSNAGGATLDRFLERSIYLHFLTFEIQVWAWYPFGSGINVSLQQQVNLLGTQQSVELLSPHRRYKY